jgi:hypothetical protein
VGAARPVLVPRARHHRRRVTERWPLISLALCLFHQSVRQCLQYVLMIRTNKSA